MRIQAFLTAAAINLKRLATALVLLFLALVGRSRTMIGAAPYAMPSMAL
jgi:hypothetical protein